VPEPVERVFFIEGPRRRARLRLRGSFFIVGRGEPFPVFHDDPMMSREHLAVVACPEGVRVRDLGSKNGVLLNGARLGRYAEVPLAPGDVLLVGQTKLSMIVESELEHSLVTADQAAPPDEHQVDEQGKSRAIRLGSPPPFAQSEPPPVDDPGSGSEAQGLDPDETAASGLTELGEIAEVEPDDLPGEATSELDVPAIPAEEPPTGAVAAPEAEEPPPDVAEPERRETTLE
jgi:pSer/pThr/pTyr-binding forkhead associated (FHA) protein